MSHLAHSSTTSWMWRDQRSKCSHGHWGGVYDPDFITIHEDREKKGKVCNALVTFINLTVMNDHGSSDRISSVDSLLIPMLLLQNFKRVIPPRTGLLRLAHSSPFCRFLVDLPKEGISVKRSIPGHPWRRIRGNKFLRMGRKSNLVHLMRN
jgi:hypothetical protein